MDLSQAPAFVAAKMAILSDGCAAAVIRADELTAQIRRPPRPAEWPRSSANADHWRDCCG